MPSDISIVIADVTRLSAIRDGVRLAGRAMHFTGGNLGTALESIRTHQPKLVAIDALLARTPQGAAFVDRVEKLAVAGSDIRLIAKRDGGWVTMSRDSDLIVAASGPAVVAASRPPVVAAHKVALNTRRAPRFLVRDPLKAVVENGGASLVDISVLGAQIMSEPALRPNQKIKVALPDTDDMLHVTAHVAWSMFEKPTSATEAHYRAGIEFADAAQRALEEYRRRHCSDEPIPYRG